MIDTNSPENCPTSSQLLDEIRNCKDLEKMKSLADKLQDAMAIENSSSKDRWKKIVEKWAQKLKPIKNEEGIKICANLLETQHRTVKEYEVEYDNAKKKADLLEEQANELEGEVKAIILAQVDKLRQELPFLWSDSDEFRGVNIYDEIIKAYDCCIAKDLVGIQPMYGPVGLAYGLRFRPSPPVDPTAFSSATMEEISLTVEQKEALAGTQQIKIRGKKFSYEDIQMNWDRLVIGELVKLPVEKSVPNNAELLPEIVKSVEGIARDTKMGAGNVIVSGSSIEFEIPNGVKHIKVDGVLEKILKNKIIIAYRGKRESDAGLILTPYIPFVLSKAVGMDFKPSHRILSRNGIATIYKSEVFYRILEVVSE